MIHALSGIATEDLPYIQRSSLSMACRMENSDEGNLLDESGLSVIPAKRYNLVLVNSLCHLQDK